MALITLTVGPVAHGGVCVARMGADAPTPGKVVFVRHTLPGEIVRAQVVQTNAGYARADAIEILSASPDRVPNPWPQAGPGGVGGGELAHVSRPAQLRWKAAVIAEQFTRVAHLAQNPPVVAVGPPLGYRTRVRLVAGADGRLGMYRARSREVMALDSMPLATAALRDLPVWQERFTPGTRVLLVDAASGVQVVVDDEQMQVSETLTYAGQQFTYTLPAAGFWQVNASAPPVLVTAVMQAAQAQAGMRVWDLYCGAGLFTKPLAAAVGPGGWVHGVDNALGCAEDFAPQVRLTPGRVERVLTCEPVDLIVADPPRSGAGRQVCRAMAAARPARIVYVACDPAALARDSAFLAQAGYGLRHVSAFDLFSMTHHVEQVAVFEPGLD